MTVHFCPKENKTNKKMVQKQKESLPHPSSHVSMVGKRESQTCYEVMQWLLFDPLGKTKELLHAKRKWHHG
jgi:hypothetical protein